MYQSVCIRDIGFIIFSRGKEDFILVDKEAIKHWNCLWLLVRKGIMKIANLKKEIKAESFAKRTKPQKQNSDTYLQSVAAGLGFGKIPPQDCWFFIFID